MSKWTWRLVGAVFLACASWSSFAGPAAYDGSFEDCLEFFPGSQPPVITDSSRAPGKRYALCFSEFAVLYSGQTKTPLAVAEFISRESLKQAATVPREGRFYEEARLPAAYRATLADYRGSGWDRGHLVAAAQMQSPLGMAQSFSLANIVPQASVLNRGAWATNVEEATRRYARRSSRGVWVITGPIFSSDSPSIGPGRVRVPEALYKLVFDPGRGRAWAHVVENRDDAKVGRPVSYQELKSRVGIDLLPGVVSGL